MIRMRHLLAAALAVLATPVFADGLVENVNGITLDKDGKVVRFTALLIDREGKVSQLLTSRDKVPKQLDFRHDGKGLTMLPGLIDAHGHVMGLGFAALTLDLSGTNSLAEAHRFVGRLEAGDAHNRRQHEIHLLCRRRQQPPRRSTLQLRPFPLAQADIP